MTNVNPFAQVASAKATGGGNYIKDGKYLLKVKEITMPTLHSGTCFIAEFEVVEAEATHKDKEGKVTAPNAVGSTCAMVQNFTRHGQTAPGNTKNFLLALLGVSEDEVVAEEFEATVRDACGSKRPLAGRLVRCETYRKWTKDKTKELVLPNWTHVPEGEAAPATDLPKKRSFLKK